MDRRKYINVYHVKVEGDNGTWLDLVFATDEESAIEKVKETYGRWHKRVEVFINDSYDYVIE